MMIRRFMVFLFVLGTALTWHPGIGSALEKAPAIDPRAAEVLQEMSAYLNSLKEFTFHAENTTEEIRTTGQKLQFANAVDVFVQRPDRIRANSLGDKRTQEFYYDGKSITLFGKDLNNYASLKAPAKIDEALNHARESFGLQAPLADIVYQNPHEILTDGATSGTYLGLHSVHGVTCHHLAFTRDDIDLQIWIENGEKPLPRKLIITDKWVTGAPQFTALLSDWDLSPQLKEALFTFVAPDQAEKLEFYPVKR